MLYHDLNLHLNCTVFLLKVSKTVNKLDFFPGLSLRLLARLSRFLSRLSRFSRNFRLRSALSFFRFFFFFFFLSFFVRLLSEFVSVGFGESPCRVSFRESIELKLIAIYCSEHCIIRIPRDRHKLFHTPRYVSMYSNTLPMYFSF